MDSDEQMNGSITRLVDGYMNGLMDHGDGQMDGSIARLLIDGWIDG